MASAYRWAPARPFTLLRAGSIAATRHVIVLRFLLLNMLAVALVTAVWERGWLDAMIRTDVYHMVKLNCAIFLVGLALCGRRIMQVSNDLNNPSRYWHYNADGQRRVLLAEALKMRFAVRLGTIRHVAHTIVLVGLIGTVIGFIIALSGVNAEAATDPHAIAPMISTLLLGMAIALYKTLVGSVLNVWLMANYRILEGGTVHLITDVIEHESGHA
jgi:biopolymer transport protein ExbB/TolQ